MDQYEMVRVLGEGSFGSAVLAKDRASQQLLVLKRIPLHKLPGQAVADAKKEVQVLSSLHHPHVTVFVRSFECGGELIIGMEYCAGGDLKAVLGQRAGVLLPQDRILDWFVQLCLAVKYIHDRHILHRDIKAQNIFLTEDGRVKLGDFGISKVLESSKELASTCIGTPYYLSPEMCQNKPYNSKSDVWALGCVLYEMAALRHPFEATCMKSLVMKILRGSVRPVPAKFTWDFKALVRQILQSNPQARPSVTTILAKNILLDRVPKFLVGIDGNLDLIIALKERKDAAKGKGKKLLTYGSEITAPAAKYGLSVASKTTIRRMSPLKNVTVKRPSPKYLKKSSPKYGSKSSLASSKCLPKTSSLLPERSLNQSPSKISSQRRPKSKSVDYNLEDNTVSVSLSKLIQKKSLDNEALSLDCHDDGNTPKQSVNETKALTPDVESILRDISNGKYCIKNRSPDKMSVNETKIIKTSSNHSNHRFRRKRDSVGSIVKGKSVDSLLDGGNDNCHSPTEAAASDTFFDIDHISPKNKENIESDETRDKNVNSSGVVGQENRSKFVLGSTVSDSRPRANSDLNEIRAEKVKCCIRTRLFSRDLSPVRAVKPSMTSSPCSLRRSASLTDVFVVMGPPTTVSRKHNSKVQCDRHSDKEHHSMEPHLDPIGDSLVTGGISRPKKSCLGAEEEVVASVCSSTPIRSSRPHWSPWNPDVLAQAPLETTRSQMDATSGADKVTLHLKRDQACNLLNGAKQNDVLKAAVAGGPVSPVLSRAVDVEFDLIRLAVDNKTGSRGERKTSVPKSDLTETYLKSPDSVNGQKLLVGHEFEELAHLTERRQWTRPESCDIVEWLNSAKIVEATLDCLQTSALLTSLLREGESPLRRAALPHSSGQGCDSSRPRDSNNCYKSPFGGSFRVPNSEFSNGLGGKSTGNCGKAALKESLMQCDVSTKDDHEHFEKISEGTFLISSSKQEGSILSTTYTKVEGKCSDSVVPYETEKKSSVTETNVENLVYDKPCSIKNTEKCFKKPTNRLLNFLLRRDSQNAAKVLSSLQGSLSTKKSPVTTDEGTANNGSILGDGCLSFTDSESNANKSEYPVGGQDVTAESKRGLAHVLRKMARAKSNGPKAPISTPFSCGYRKQVLTEKPPSETKLTSEHDVHHYILVSNSSHTTTSADRSGSMNDLNFTQSYNFKCNNTEKRALVSDKNIKMSEVFHLNASVTDRMHADASLRCSSPSTTNTLCTDESGYNTQTTVSSSNSQSDRGNTAVPSGRYSYGREVGTKDMGLSASSKRASTISFSLQERPDFKSGIHEFADACAVPIAIASNRDLVSKRLMKVDANIPIDGSSASDCTVLSPIGDGRPPNEATPVLDSSNSSFRDRDVQVRRLAEILVGSIIRKSKERYAVENVASNSDKRLEDLETCDIFVDGPTSCEFEEKTFSSVNSSDSAENVSLRKILEFLDPDVVNRISQVNMPNACFSKSELEENMASKYIPETVSFCFNEGSHVPDTSSQENELSETHTYSTTTNNENINKINATSEQKMLDNFYSCLYSTLGSNCTSKMSPSEADIRTRPFAPVIQQPTSARTSIVFSEPSRGGSVVGQFAASCASNYVFFERTSAKGPDAFWKETPGATVGNDAGVLQTRKDITVVDVPSYDVGNNDVPSSNNLTPSPCSNHEFIESQGTFIQRDSHLRVENVNPYELSPKLSHVEFCTPNLAGSNTVCLIESLASDAASEHATQGSDDGCSMPDVPASSPLDRLKVAEVCAEDGDSFYSALGDLDAVVVNAPTNHRTAPDATAYDTRCESWKNTNTDTSGNTGITSTSDVSGGILHAADSMVTKISSSEVSKVISLPGGTPSNYSFADRSGEPAYEVDVGQTVFTEHMVGSNRESDVNCELAIINQNNDKAKMLSRYSDEDSCRCDANKEEALSYECGETECAALVESSEESSIPGRCILNNSQQIDKDYLGSDINLLATNTWEKSSNVSLCDETLDRCPVTPLINASSCVSCNNSKLLVAEGHCCHLLNFESGISNFQSSCKSELASKKFLVDETAAKYLDSDAITLTFPSDASEDFCIKDASTCKLTQLVIDFSHETQCTTAKNSSLHSADFSQRGSSSKSFGMNGTANKPPIEHMNAPNSMKFVEILYHPITNCRCDLQSPVPSDETELVAQNNWLLVNSSNNSDFTLSVPCDVEISADNLKLPNHQCHRTSLTSPSSASASPSASNPVYSPSRSQCPTSCVWALASGPAQASVRHATCGPSWCAHLPSEPLSEGSEEDVFGWIEQQRAQLEDCLGLGLFKKCHAVATQAVEDGASVNALVELLFRMLTSEGTLSHKGAEVHFHTPCSLHKPSAACVKDRRVSKCCFLKKQFEVVGPVACTSDPDTNERLLLDRNSLANQMSSLEQQGTVADVCLPSTLSVGAGARSSCAGCSKTAAPFQDNSDTRSDCCASCSPTIQNIPDLVGNTKELVVETISSQHDYHTRPVRSPSTARLERFEDNNEEGEVKHYSLPDDSYFKKYKWLMSDESHSSHQPKNLELSVQSSADAFAGGPYFKDGVRRSEDRNSISPYSEAGDQTKVSAATKLIKPSPCAFKSINGMNYLGNAEQGVHDVTSHTLNSPSSTSSEMVESVVVVDGDSSDSKQWLQDLSISLLHLVRAEAAYWT